METRIIHIKTLLFLSLLLLLNSCSAKKENTLYSFGYEVKDTNALKDIVLVLRLPDRCSGGGHQMMINIISPSGERYTDSVVFPSISKSTSPAYSEESFKVVNSGIWRDSRWVYRRGVRFPSKGKWQFVIYTQNTDPKCVKELFLTVE